MTKDNADIDYDPELPFAYLDNGNIQLYARFKHRSDAEVFRDRCNFGNIVDTTPKPKIPEDAEFIAWYDPSDNGEERIARRYGHPANKVWRIGWDTIEESELMSYIGDAEVTVLVRKEGTS